LKKLFFFFFFFFFKYCASCAQKQDHKQQQIRYNIRQQTWHQRTNSGLVARHRAGPQVANELLEQQQRAVTHVVARRRVDAQRRQQRQKATPRAPRCQRFLALPQRRRLHQAAQQRRHGAGVVGQFQLRVLGVSAH
jgi:hypothetical protein